MINKNIKKTMITTFVTSALLLGAIVPSAFADSIHVSGNGAFSDTNVSVKHTNQTSINQRNDSNIRNNVRVNSSTGNNRSSFNTGGDNVISTGDAHNSVEISNNAGFNYASNRGEDSWRGGNSWNEDWNSNNGKELEAALAGSNEVPGPGDTDGMGNAQVTVHPSKDELCVDMHVEKIDAANAAHIHNGAAGVAGPVVVELPTPNADGHVSGCVSADKELLKEIKHNPSHYYVNVHNAAFPSGAIRGQLSK